MAVNNCKLSQVVSENQFHYECVVSVLHLQLQGHQYAPSHEQSQAHLPTLHFRNT